mmetsp:Transcript_26537/g.87164  ORF Transcript_26537/g.87164 Transcript_26537/m.87164 type:complete len:248 (+) Transcript_26537:1070-1813(+)
MHCSCDVSAEPREILPFVGGDQSQDTALVWGLQCSLTPRKGRNSSLHVSLSGCAGPRRACKVLWVSDLPLELPHDAAAVLHRVLPPPRSGCCCCDDAAPLGRGDRGVWIGVLPKLDEEEDEVFAGVEEVCMETAHGGYHHTQAFRVGGTVCRESSGLAKGGGKTPRPSRNVCWDRGPFHHFTLGRVVLLPCLRCYGGAGALQRSIPLRFRREDDLLPPPLVLFCSSDVHVLRTCKKGLGSKNGVQEA